ncbi:SMI1/KNR4 family protein, partial [Pandoraea sputorum]|uniref:SMI1/KNR4 family protein n=1 Tax=Pandoraea sputorum TaxID=93222 RepID=UPI0035580AEA
LCFSQCMNNGGTSRLYIDFNPGAGGSVGQEVRYLHDPDSYKVIAASFDDYLKQLIDQNYEFIFEDE